METLTRSSSANEGDGYYTQETADTSVTPEATTPTLSERLSARASGVKKLGSRALEGVMDGVEYLADGAEAAADKAMEFMVSSGEELKGRLAGVRARWESIRELRSGSLRSPNGRLFSTKRVLGVGAMAAGVFLAVRYGPEAANNVDTFVDSFSGGLGKSERFGTPKVEGGVKRKAFEQARIMAANRLAR